MANYPTEGNDTLIGSDAAETIDGLAGNDTIRGNGGDDTLIGGTGDDVFLIGGTASGNDIFNGGDGSDQIRLYADLTVSSLLLDSAHVLSTETLNFYSYDIEGTGAADSFNLSGITYASSYSRIYMYDGNDSFTGYQGNDNVDGGSGNDTLRGGGGNDTLIGGSGNDSLDGGSGNDVFYISGTESGYDVFNGGDGADEIRMVGDVTVSSLQLTASNVLSTETLNFYSYDIEGTGGNDVFNLSGITYASSYSRIFMFDGNDSFTGYQGNDNVDGGAGNDTLRGGAGSDTLIGGSGNDSLDGGSGDDVFYISGTDFGADIYNGGLGSDQIRLVGDIMTSRFVLTTNVAGTEALNLYGYDIEGTGGNDVFNLSGIATVYSYSWIELNDGNDVFVGYRGDDYVRGGAGNDTLTGGAGNDRLDGGTGVDLVGYGGASSGVTVNLGLTGAQVIGGGQGSDTLTSIENVNGSAYADVLSGNAGNNLLMGNSGNDRLGGGAGDDTLNGGLGVDTASYARASSGVTVNLGLTSAQLVGGGQGRDVLISIESLAGSAYADRLVGNSGVNTLSGGAGNDRLEGLAGNDSLLGGLGNDSLLGGSGADVVNGGAGNDVLYGGTEADAFVFAVNDGADRVMDFQDGIDRIRLVSGSWQGERYDSFADLDITRTAAGSAVVSFGGTTITLAGVAPGSLSAADFVFV